MNVRKLGRTALELSVVGFGSSPFGDVYGNTSPSEIRRAVDTAIELGINFFDTSPYYGLTLAETRLGEAIADKRKQILLATKCGRYDVAGFDFSRTAVRKSVEASLCRLKTDYIDLLQAHDIEFAPEQQIIEETIPALRELQKEGKTRYIGITGYPLQVLRRVAEAAPVDSILSYCHYTLLNTEMAETLARFAEHAGIGLINASPLMMGLLTEAGPPLWHAASPELRQAASRAAAASKARGAAIEVLALQFSLQQSFAASTLVGMATAAEVRQNVAALALPIDQDVLQTVKQAAGSGFPTTWHSGLQGSAQT